jgi:toxin CcdB
MARLDVHPMPGEHEGYVREAERLSHLATCIVVPLLPEDSALKPIATLNPASIARRALDSAVASLAEDDDSITCALGLLLVGD